MPQRFGLGVGRGRLRLFSRAKLRTQIWAAHRIRSPHPPPSTTQVEEVSAAVADKKTVAKENSDPLEQFCEGDPSADECRVYGACALL